MSLLHGCHNRPPFKPGYYAPDRTYNPDGTFEARLVWIPGPTSNECHNDHVGDAGCIGCPKFGESAK